uniref:BZIP domain-containing protein n=1 Tax=Steinernema glaseri TaxID=37863 RepID=A0A1I8AB47_9BILA
MCWQHLMTPSLEQNKFLSDKGKRKVCKRIHALLCHKWTRGSKGKYLLARDQEMQRLKRIIASQKEARASKEGELENKSKADTTEMEAEIAQLRKTLEETRKRRKALELQLENCNAI